MDVPSTGAVHKILLRHGRAVTPAPPAPPLRFERSAPNHLWQIDFKGPLSGPPSTSYLLTVIDDHSRYLLALRLCHDQTMATAWGGLWGAFGNAGLPRAILSDNGFAPRGASVGGLSWLEARLLRLRIEALHGRPYHPQTQGKVERVHRTLEAELLRLDWTLPEPKVAGHIERWRTEVYNTLRPHEGFWETRCRLRVGTRANCRGRRDCRRSPTPAGRRPERSCRRGRSVGAATS